eukprot:425256-Rhodomonas_salina.1
MKPPLTPAAWEPRSRCQYRTPHSARPDNGAQNGTFFSDALLSEPPSGGLYRETFRDPGSITCTVSAGHHLVRAKAGGTAEAAPSATCARLEPHDAYRAHASPSSNQRVGAFPSFS